ncbi:MAG: NupC/NupG family nucleoside CNT transporter [Microcoleaceae cyanobacterium]
MERLISLFGILTFIGIGYLISNNRRAIRWRTVLWGIALQLIIAVFVLKIPGAYRIFDVLGQAITQFLNFTNEGSEFVFGENYTDHPFAFQVLPTIIFFSAFVSILYFLGILQRIVQVLAWVMLKTAQTSGAESLSNAANVFVGMTEAPLLVKPFIGRMTRSELNTVMTGGFATVAGGVLAAYVSFGIPAQDLVTASVMAAPCALGISKLLYPETEKPETAGKLEFNMEKNASNVIDAAAGGAIEGSKLAINIAAIMIAFLGLIALLNSVLGWLGGNIGIPQLSLDFILGIVLYPVAFLTGVPQADVSEVAALIGTKVIINEFVAYGDLVNLIKDNAISPRAARIASFALCSFANIGSIGIQIGGLGGIAPERRSDLAEIGIRAMGGGVITNLIVASTA